MYSIWRCDAMATMTIRMNDDVAEVAKMCAAFEGKTFSDFARDVITERVEDMLDVKTIEDAIREDDGRRYTIDQLLAEHDA